MRLNAISVFILSNPHGNSCDFEMPSFAYKQIRPEYKRCIPSSCNFDVFVSLSVYISGMQKGWMKCDLSYVVIGECRGKFTSSVLSKFISKRLITFKVVGL